MSSGGLSPDPVAEAFRRATSAPKLPPHDHSIVDWALALLTGVLVSIVVFVIGVLILGLPFQ